MSPVETIVANPFPGLRPFHEEEEYLFFGRESQVHAMVDTLASTRFLAVVGPSGSGKSSLVNCGLRPALRRGLMTSAGTAWRIVQFRPGRRPLEAMAHALADEGVLFTAQFSDDVSMDMLVELDLRMSRRGLVEIYRQAHLPEHVNLLIVVDQFEELFRFGSVDDYVTRRKYGTDEKARAFVSLLIESAKQSEHPIFLVLTMRSDFLGDCAEFPDLSEAINKGLFLVPRMKRHERREAIAGPVAVGGADISPVLLTRLVNDVGDNPDQLSILQHALNRTWSRWEHEGGGEGPLDLPHYEAIGTMARALDQHAEKAYAELGSERRQYICEKIFKALTDKSTDPRGIRRPTKLGTLCALAEAEEDEIVEVVEVIDVFRKPSRSFLMPPLPEVLTAETVIDISHESLMRVWERLKRWADEEVASARMYGRLADAAVRYRAGQVGLLRDPELQLALDWREGNHPTAAWASLHRGVFPATMRFLDESLAQREKEIRDEEERRRNELEQARALAEEQGRVEEQSKRARRLRVAFLIAAAFAILAAAAGMFGTRSAQEAKKQRALAETNAVAARLNEERALDNLKEAEANRREAELQAGIAREQRREAEANRQRAEANFRKAEAEAARAEFEAQRALALADTAEQRRLDAEASLLEADSAREVARSARLKTLSLALANKARRQQELDNPELGALLAREAFRVNKRVEGEFLTEVFDALRVNLNALPETHANPTPIGHRDGVRAVAVRPGGGLFASAGNDGRVYLWSARDQAARLEEPRGKVLVHSKDRVVRSIAFSADGRRLVSAGDDRRVVVWELGGSYDERVLKGHGSPVLSSAFSPDGRRVAAGARDGKIILWDVNSQKRTAELVAHRGAVKAVVFSPNGRFLVSTGSDGWIRWWNLETKRPVDRLQHAVAEASSAVNDLAVSPDGLLLASAGDDGIVRVWRMADRTNEYNLRGHMGAVNAVAFSGDGGRIASGGADGSARLWMTDRRLRNDMALREALRGPADWVLDVAFSVRGDTLISGGADRKVRIWRLDSESLTRDICMNVGRAALDSLEWIEFVGPDIPFSEHEPCGGTNL